MYYAFEIPQGSKGIISPEFKGQKIAIGFTRQPMPTTNDPFVGFIFNLSPTPVKFVINGNKGAIRMKRKSFMLVYAPYGFSDFYKRNHAWGAIFVIQFSDLFFTHYINKHDHLKKAINKFLVQMTLEFPSFIYRKQIPTEIYEKVVKIDRLSHNPPIIKKSIYVGAVFEVLESTLDFIRFSNSFVHRAKMTEIAEELTKSHTLKEIAKKVGYSSTSSMARAFKHSYHCTPTQYRLQRRYRRNPED